MLKNLFDTLSILLPALLIMPGCEGGGGEGDADAEDMAIDEAPRDADAGAGDPDGAGPDGDTQGEDALPDQADITPDPPEDGDAPGELPHEIWRPAPGTSWQWQLTGTIDTSLDVQMYDLDLFETPGSVISELHSRGIVVICYFSAGSYEEWREDASSFPSDAIGSPLEGWPGESWLDTRSGSVRDIMRARLDRAAAVGCDGVEPDNVDGYTADSGFDLTYEDQIDYNTFIAGEAHLRGLSVGLKNDLEQLGDLIASFDWALNEECFTYEECDLLAPFIDAGMAVFQVEYGDESLADAICPLAEALNFDTLIKNLDLDAWRVACR